MVRFVVRRIVRAAITLFVVLLVAFGLTQIAYSNPGATIAPRNATAQEIKSIKAAYHLNEPWYEQLWHFLYRGPAIEGVKSGLVNWPPSFGYSVREQTAVTPLILSKAPATASLALGAIVIWMALSLLFGVVAAWRPGSWTDRIISWGSYVGLAVPTFVAGILLSYFLFFKLSTAGVNWFPNSGYVPLTQNPLQWARHLLLPWATIAIGEIGVFQRVVRGSMLDVLGSDYIRTARAKGVSERRVYFNHALKSALTPVITLGGLELAGILGGAIVTEDIFGIDGVGRLALTSTLNGDFPVVIGTTVFASVVFICSTFAVDVITHLRDPSADVALL